MGTRKGKTMIFYKVECKLSKPMPKGDRTLRISEFTESSRLVSEIFNQNISKYSSVFSEMVITIGNIEL